MNRCYTAFFTFVFICLVATASIADANNIMSIQVKKGHLRTAPSFLGKIIATLDYGDRVDVIEEKNTWFRVRVPATVTSGWIHATALTSKKIVLSAGAADVDQAATSDELALAGKGFNKQVEGEFRAKNRHLDYTWIDKMEGFVMSQAQIEQFIKYGDLSPRGGHK